MAWTTPATYTSGQVLNAVALNLVRDNLLSLRNRNDQYVKLSLTGNPSIPNTTDTKITWTQTDLQVGTIWAGGNPTRLTAPVTGKYLIIVNVEWRRSSVNFRNITLLKAGVTWALKAQGSVGGKSNVSGTRIMALTAGEFFECQVFQNSGGALLLHGGAPDRTRCSMILLGV